ncbi:hypothetical protein [Deinococcus alpinitundrae]|uniref:hypothetical protein n=1 Tax=Deinococcus alpinitundrae TaxID=468913 RepID=UPI00137B5400|nr:hypothetical protein [Deinococcus alpinitundrae]
MTSFAERWPLTTRHTLDVQKRRKTLEARARLVVEPLPPVKPSKGRKLTRRKRKALKDKS